MIRSVDLTVAVRAATVEEKHRSRRPRRNRMLHGHVALGAKPRVGNLEQTVVDGAMRLVAISAIFKRRRMRPKKRAAPLGMARVAVFIDTGLFELCRIRRPVRIVATGADELSLSQGHMG